MKTTIQIDWADTLVRIVAFRAANQQVKSVAPDLGMSPDDERDLAASQEIITAHTSGLIDLDSSDFEYTSSLLFDTVATIENAYDTRILTTDA
jgi:hypothetical protein